MDTVPGYITVSKDAVYALRPDLDDRIVAHIEQWRDSVPTGTAVTIDKMLNCSATCGCPADAQSVKCKGSGHGMAMEIVMDHIFPEDGSPCAIKGVQGVITEGPLWEQALGHLKMIEKIS